MGFGPDRGFHSGDAVILAEAVILAGCKAVESIFTFLSTPEGQLQAKEWREDRAKMKADLDSFANLFKPIFHK